MKILKVDKDKAQIELNKEEVDAIEWGMGLAEDHTFDKEYGLLQKEFKEILGKMKK